MKEVDMEYLALIAILTFSFLLLAFMRVGLASSLIILNIINFTWIGFSDLSGIYLILSFFFLFVTIVLSIPAVRMALLSSRIFTMAKPLMPQVSATEQEALDAGTTWWDKDLWSGSPDWKNMLDMPEIKLTKEEKNFLNGPVDELCKLLDDWDITHNRLDLPQHVWDFIKENGFFGIIIPKIYGGLGFSATAHSAIIAKIAGRSITAAVTVMVPNSLGPAELLQHYGTPSQKQKYLPRLATGEEVPCFGLTNPDAGSDASAIPDEGVICRGTFEGQDIIGIRINWSKRYITMGPVATIIGVAFKLRDPDKLLNDPLKEGITFALIPRELEGVSIGNRHFPLNCPFQVGPNRGKDVFIPMSMVIGEENGLGKGWSMLMEALAAGRGISLPALSSGGAQVIARAIGAYAAIRKQFNLSIGRFEGIQEALTRIAGYTYMMNAARRITLTGIDSGQKPAVLTGIVKYQLTEMMRLVINDGMDIQAGAGICLGPRNLLGRIYQAAPIGVTVEGANILTRSFIVFNQSLLRCHPFYYQEISAIKQNSLVGFDKAFWRHVSFIINNLSRSLFAGLGLTFAFTSSGHRATRKYQKQLTRFSNSFAFVADTTAILLGTALKRKERITGRLADCLSHLFLAASVIKQFHNDGCPKEDLVLVNWCCQHSLHVIELRLKEVIDNLPNRAAAKVMSAIVFPFGKCHPPPPDWLAGKVAKTILTPNLSRSRLTRDVFIPKSSSEPLARLEQFLEHLDEIEDIEKQIRTAVKAGIAKQSDDIETFVQNEVITQEQAKLLAWAVKARSEIVAVDEFPSLP